MAKSGELKSLCVAGIVLMPYRGTVLGPFVNVVLMQVVIDKIGIPTLKGDIPSVNWLAVTSRSFYSISVLWGVIGPKVFFGSGSPYHFV